MPPPFITRVRLKNYKSIGYCDVELQALTFLVGPNGSGKSNFLDAIQFVSDGLRNSLDHAIRERGGISQVRRRFAEDHPSFSIRLDFRLSQDLSGFYAVEVEAQPDDRGYAVKEEQCSLNDGANYRVRNGIVDVFSGGVAPAAASNRLFLTIASGFPEFRRVFDALSEMGFYNINPDHFRELQRASSSALLLHDGRNISGVFDRLSKDDPAAKLRIEKFLSAILGRLTRAESYVLGGLETVMFQQELLGSETGSQFLTKCMSDGTLRAFGVLVALLQFGLQPGASPHLIGIEEPESALHPSGASILFDAIQDASRRLQVIVTTHSPELIEDKSLPIESILAVASENGETQIGRIDDSGREILRSKLTTAGELLRVGHITPDPDEIERLRSEQGSFFEAAER